MIDHISVAVSDVERSRRFYTDVLAPLGLSQIVLKKTTIGFGKTYPEFWINLRAGMAPVESDSGVHICLRAASRDAVEAFYDAAVKSGGTAEAEPRMWPEYNDRYVAAFIRDPDGNRLEAVHFVEPKSEMQG